MVARILLVDDDDSLRENYREILEDTGYEIADCGEVSDALRLFSERYFDLVILDISMRGDRSAGHKLCQAMKAQNAATPIAMLTSLDGTDNRRIAHDNGACGYWIKDADISGFIHNVKTMLATARRD